MLKADRAWMYIITAINAISLYMVVCVVAIKLLKVELRFRLVQQINEQYHSG